jgi:CIC family chloride channel protein
VKKGWLDGLLSHPAAARMRALIRPAAGPLELGLFSRTLLLAAAVGVVAGGVGAAFVAALDFGQRVLLEQGAGAVLLRAMGERSPDVRATNAMPWLLCALPALGALVGGWLCRLAPETYGGGGDATIATFHGAAAEVRPRTLAVKFFASVATLASGGAGGREGPAMQLGSSAGALLAEWLPTTARERRVLFVAGIGAGVSAVFRTPLGAALLAVEVLYRDDFDSDALVPSVLASVVSFSVSNALLGTRPLFGVLPAHSFQAMHLPLYALLAVVAAAAGAAFVGALHAVRDAAARSKVPRWAAPAAGGLVLGATVVTLRAAGISHIGPVPIDSALLGGGYGVAQLAVAEVANPSLVAGGWFIALAALRIAATGLTVGTGGSAGDFAPALVVGGLTGAAFGHVAATLFPGSGIHPSNFALVGMATLYGGIAHAPLSAVILVSELAGSYDLLVPLMLGTVAAHLMLRNVQLYPSQEPNRRRAFLRSQVPHGEGGGLLVSRAASFAPLKAASPTDSLDTVRATAASGQPVIPVLERNGEYVGLIPTAALVRLLAESEIPGAVAADLAGPPVQVGPGEQVRIAAERMIEEGLTHLPVLEDGRVVGLVSLSEILKTTLGGSKG